MELDRPHLRSSSSSNNASNNNNELFICFASRLSSSSSSMKIAKSILSPGRAACDAPVSLSNSLSRRLKSNGSMKGGQASPMFPSVGKKKGCNFENPEPSSPKVTCIGQVRVKTKKKASQTRSLSRRRSGGEVSFRKAGESHEFVSLNNEDRFSGRNSRHVQECLPERNQRWVHFPVTICEALRAVGAEFSCLFPCGSSCFSTKEKEEKSSTIRDESDQESCGAVFARWFVSLQDCEGRQAKQIELVVGGDEDRTEVMERKSMRSSRRHVFEDIQFNHEKIELKVEEEGEQEEEKGRVSICVPPKNALLLMRCRSDPIQMAVLTNRVWESPALTKDEEDEEDPDEEISKKDVREDPFLREFSQIINETEPVVGHENEKSQDIILGEDEKGLESVEKDANLVEEMQDNEDGKTDEQLQFNEESQQLQIEAQTLLEAILRSSEAHVIQEVGENIVQEVIQENGEEESCSPSRHSSSSGDMDELAEKMETGDEQSEPEEAFSEAAPFEELEESENKTVDSSVDEKFQDPDDDEMQVTTRLESQEDLENSNKDAENNRQESGVAERVMEMGENFEENKEESFSGTKKIDNESSTTSSSPAPAKVLPDCLLLMMCEPKLSMDMSKETWVCSTDFVRWLPERPVKKVNDESKKTITTEVLNLKKPHQPPAAAAAAAQDSKTRKKKQQTMQPPRSSCTLPAAAAASMATMIEQKLVNAVGYEPCVLTRCKSEPMRTAAAKLVPDACCWKNRKLETHRQAAFGVGAAGLGF